MIELAKYIPWLPALSAILCGLCCLRKNLRGLSAPICAAGVFAAFLISVLVNSGLDQGGRIVHAFDWIHVGGAQPLVVNFSYFIDPLTIIMLFVVTGVGFLVVVYASGYMKGDVGYARFFAYVSLFIFAMTSLVLADNLVLLYLGWEGVGLCSYLLIGYYHQKPSAVAAAKKAFIVNRIGDLGFALGIFLIWRTYGTVTLGGEQGVIAQASAGPTGAALADTWIPFLLMLGAFGKSAQIPLYVWLPDAMEGPTPVSALIHAATMVTAGVYMIARLLPVFELSAYALPTVAVVGALTAFLAATIATCQNDLKKVFAYSTISQLGYMFLGVGVAATLGGVFHLFTHAFFKALLFLTAGSVMHACAGQLDLKKISGLRRKMPVTCWLMFIGCLALAGVPYIGAGFYSKDMIIAAALDQGLGAAHGEHGQSAGNPLFVLLGLLAIATAALTAYYTFRLWFRVFMGPEFFEMGDEHSHADDDHAHNHANGRGAHHEPHEMPWLMNAPLLVLAFGSLFVLPVWLGGAHGWFERMIADSSAASEVKHASHGVHLTMIVVSFVVSLGGVATAAYFHLWRRDAADRLAERWRHLVTFLTNKWYVDELYDAVIVRPLYLLGQLFFVFDCFVIDALVGLVGSLPGAAGRLIQPAQRGRLQGYGLGMMFAAAGVVLLMLIVLM